MFLYRSMAGPCLAAGFALLGAALVPTLAQASIVSVTNLTIVSPPSDVGFDFIVNAGLPDQLIFAEQQNVTLAAPLAVDTGGIIAAGTKVNSYLVAANSYADTIVVLGARFGEAILGINYTDDSLIASDFLGAAGTNYVICSNCGYESGDVASFAGKLATFSIDYSEPGDFARVITGVNAAPLPAALPMMLTGLIGLGAAALRARKRKTA